MVYVSVRELLNLLLDQDFGRALSIWVRAFGALAAGRLV